MARENAWRRCACPPARCASCATAAAARSARSATPSPERQDRQGRTQAPHRRAPADARHHHEPRRPSARRRRGPTTAGRHPVTPWVCQRSATAREEDKPSDRYIVRGRRRREEAVSRSSKKGPWVEERLMARVEALNASNSSSAQDLVSCLDHLPRDRRSHHHRPQRPQARPDARLGEDGQPEAGEFAPTRLYRGHAGRGKVRSSSPTRRHQGDEATKTSEEAARFATQEEACYEQEAEPLLLLPPPPRGRPPPMTRRPPERSTSRPPTPPPSAAAGDNARLETTPG